MAATSHCRIVAYGQAIGPILALVLPIALAIGFDAPIHRNIRACHVIAVPLVGAFAAEHHLAHGLLGVASSAATRSPVALSDWSANLWASSVTSSARSRARLMAT